MANNIVGKVCAGVITATYLVFMGYMAWSQHKANKEYKKAMEKVAEL